MAIVLTVMVAVVNNFIAFQAATQNLFCNELMLISVAVSLLEVMTVGNANKNIALTTQ